MHVGCRGRAPRILNLGTSKGQWLDLCTGDRAPGTQSEDDWVLESASKRGAQKTPTCLKGTELGASTQLIGMTLVSKMQVSYQGEWSFLETLKEIGEYNY